MNKYIALSFVAALLISLIASPSPAQNKVIRKTVTKIVRPSIAPTPAPQQTGEEENVPLPPPPPTSEYEIKTPQENKGFFGWGLNTDINGNYAITPGQSGLLGLVGGQVNLLFADPTKSGAKIGLAEDALEFKTGLGLVFGSTDSGGAINSIPLFLESVLYLKEKSLFGLDPYVGAGLIFNLYGTGGVSGGLGSQLYGGALFDFGSSLGKMGVSVGLKTVKVGTALSASGIFFQATQPFVL